MDAKKAQAKTQQLYRLLSARRDSIDALDSAYAGDMRLSFASKEFADFHQNLYTEFSDNWVAVVADALSERLRVSGVSLGETKADKESAKRLWGWWEANDLDIQSSQGFLEAIIAKRSAAIIWFDKNDEPSVTWEHPSQVFVEYAADDPRRKLFALKAWVDDNTEFATLYTPTEIWKWERPFSGVDVRDGYTNSGLFVGDKVVSATTQNFGQWEPREVDDEDWPLANPLKSVPVLEIQNRPMLKRGPISDVEGALSMQDAINLFWAYLFGAADHASLPARVVTGQAPPRIPLLNKEGQKVGEQEVPLSELQKGRILWLTGQDAKIAEWSRADLDAFLNVIEVAVGHLAAQSRTPAHYFVANKGLSNINGETLIATETPLVKKAEEFMVYAQRPLRELWTLFAKITGDKALEVKARAAATQFANAGIRSDAQLSDALIKDRKAGYPFEYLLEKYGESPSTIDRIMEMRREEAFDPQFQALADRVSEDVGL